MCLRPRFIYVHRDKTSEWKKTAYKSLVSRLAIDGSPDVAEAVRPYFMNKVRVPCGTCSECLKAKQLDLAARVALYAEQKGRDKALNMHFFTLTYDEENLPLSARKAIMNVNTGEIILDSDPIQLVRTARNAKLPFDWKQIFRFHIDIEEMKISSKPRVLEFDYSLSPDENGWKDYYFVTPSLHRRDVRLWFKSARVAFEREYGHKLSEFKYVLCGEFGNKTQRPHYHILTIGLKDFEARYMCDRWCFGFTKLKKVNQYNKDGSSGFVLAAKYVSKYVYKGDFESDAVKAGYVEKPRLCLSRYIGTTIPDDLKDYYRCNDLFGKYDLDSLKISGSDTVLSIKDLIMLKNEFRKRSVLRFGLSSYLPIPKVILRFLFSVPVEFYSLKYEKNIVKTRQSVVQMAFGSFVESDFLDNYCSELRKSGYSPEDGKSSYLVSSFLSSENAALEIKEKVGKENLCEQYAKSVY